METTQVNKSAESWGQHFEVSTVHCPTNLTQAVV